MDALETSGDQGEICVNGGGEDEGEEGDGAGF